MNTYVNDEIREKFKCLEFRGKPFKFKGRTMIEAKHYRFENATFYFSFDEGFAWLITNDQSVPDWQLPKV
jgi:hypothetical protein